MTFSPVSFKFGQSLNSILRLDLTSCLRRKVRDSRGYLSFVDACLCAVISYSSAHRKTCHAMIAKAIKGCKVAAKAAPEKAAAAPTSQKPTTKQSNTNNNKGSAIASHEAPPKSKIHALNMSDETIDQHFKVLIRTNGGVETVFAAVTGNKDISRKGFKQILKTLGLDLTDAARKRLRKKISGGNAVISVKMLARFVGEESQLHTNQITRNDLAALPVEVPVLPTAFKSRPHAQEQLVAALLDSGGTSSTAVTAPKSRVSSQGMGGVGKTMLTAAVVRDERVRGGFEKIACE